MQILTSQTNHGVANTTRPFWQLRLRMILCALSKPYRITGRRELCLSSCRSIQRLLGASALSLLVTSSAVANPRDSEAEAAVQAILSNYELACVELSSQQASNSGRLRVPQSAIYELPLGAEDHAATVVYREFECEGVGFPWCGTGGCGFYIMTGDQIYQRRAAFRPQAIKVPAPAGARQALLYGVHGFTCQTPRAEPGSGATPCYEIAVWDELWQNFWTRDTAFIAVFDLRPP